MRHQQSPQTTPADTAALGSSAEVTRLLAATGNLPAIDPADIRRRASIARICGDTSVSYYGVAARCLAVAAALAVLEREEV